MKVRDLGVTIVLALVPLCHARGVPPSPEGSTALERAMERLKESRSPPRKIDRVAVRIHVDAAKFPNVADRTVVETLKRNLEETFSDYGFILSGSSAGTRVHVRIMKVEESIRYVPAGLVSLVASRNYTSTVTLELVVVDATGEGAEKKVIGGTFVIEGERVGVVGASGEKLASLYRQANLDGAADARESLEQSGILDRLMRVERYGAFLSEPHDSRTPGTYPR